MNATPTLGGAGIDHSAAPALPFDYSALPVAQLESLRSKINQMIDSIQTLQRTVEAGGQSAMPAWPDILSKYTMLLSQSHNLSMSLVGTYGGLGIGASGSRGSMNSLAGAAAGNPYERLALHPSLTMTDAQLDNDVIPLLRNQQTTDVLRVENETVRHLAEHMATRGSLGVLSIPTSQPTASAVPGLRRPGADNAKKVEYADVLAECEQIRVEHDERVERAVRAVSLLREKFDWKARVEVDQEEPEELDWDPRVAAQEGQGQDAMNVDAEGVLGHEQAHDDESNTSEEEEELEEVLGSGADQSPEGTPQPQSPLPQD